MKILVKITNEETGEVFNSQAEVTCLTIKEKTDDMILVENTGGRTQGVMNGDTYKVELVEQEAPTKEFNTLIDLIGLKPHNINIQFGK